jgi:hypothetical protein
MLGCEAIIDGRDEHAELFGDNRAQAVVLRGIPNDESAAVHPQQRGVGRGNGGWRAVQTDQDRADLDDVNVGGTPRR